MSRLGFANIGEAFMLGSDQIKNTQEEIAKLKALITESSVAKPANAQNYQRIGPAPTTTAVFEPPKKQEEDFNVLLSKLIQHPNFDDIVKNYVSFKHPEWVLKETKSTFGSVSTDAIVYIIIILILYLIIV
jgi:hypothetical protein